MFIQSFISLYSLHTVLLIYSILLRTLLYLKVQVAAPPSFNVQMGFVSLTPYDAMGLWDALMEVMRETAVSFS